MICNRYARVLAASTVFLCLSAHANDYDFEVGVSFGQTEADTRTVSLPPPIDITETSSAEADRFELRGAWFYSGLSDKQGPKARAAFVDRASSVSLSYSQTDQSSSIEITGGGLPSLESSSDFSAYVVDLRHVWKESGWYAIAGIGRAELDGELTDGTTSRTLDADSNVYSLGVGKYLGETTSVDLRLLSQDTDSSTASGVALSFSHLGSLGDTWMFGVDAALTKTDTAGDGDVYNIRGSLYPNSDVDFGLSFVRRDEERGFDSESFELFAGWFVTDNTRVFASYIEDEGSSTLTSGVDSSGFELGISSRF